MDTERGEGDRLSFEEYLRNPPPTSALGRAIAQGVDMTMTVYLMLALSPEERLEWAGNVLRTADEIAAWRSSRA